MGQSSWMRRGAVSGAVVCVIAGAVALGCQSTPSERASAAPAATPVRELPVAVATTVPRLPSADEPRAVPTMLPPPTAVRTVVPVAPVAPPAPPVPTRAVAVPPRAAGTVAAQPDAPPVPYAAMPTAQPLQPRAPRAFRTPERAGDPAFVAPQGNAAATGEAARAAEGPAASAPNAAGQRATSGVVIFRASARTAVEGFDVRATYPTSVGHFTTTNGIEANCTGAAGAFVQASDRGNGELKLIVASAQALTLPFDVFCTFAVAPGARMTASAFETRVAEVTSNAKKAEPGLVLVDVVVR